MNTVCYMLYSNNNITNMILIFLLYVLMFFPITSAIFLDDGSDNSDVGSPLRVAQCRATCLERFSNDGPRGESVCLQGPDCFMCWENCELLQSNFQVWGSMCDEKEICFPGCQEACRFHSDQLTKPQQQTQPVIYTKDEAVIRVNGTQARWPRPSAARPDQPLVYVVMRRSHLGPWRQIIQTIDLTTRVPADNNSDSTLRILVVDPNGLVTIYSPHKNRTLAMIKNGKTVNTENRKFGNRSSSNIWQIHEISLIHQKILVIAEISWEPKTVSRGVYLVTWEIDGGGLKGNLFTDSTCVTLSLWPNTIYHIQVELISHHPGVPNLKSAMLDLDTSRAQQVSTDSDINKSIKLLPPEEIMAVEIHRLEKSGMNGLPFSEMINAVKFEDAKLRLHHLELLSGIGAAIVMFIAILVALIWWCRWGMPEQMQRRNKLEENKDCPHVAVPTMVRIQGNNHQLTTSKITSSQPTLIPPAIVSSDFEHIDKQTSTLSSLPTAIQLQYYDQAVQV